TPGQVIAAMLQPDLANLRTVIDTLKTDLRDATKDLEAKANAAIPILTGTTAVESVVTAAKTLLSDIDAANAAISQLSAAASGPITGTNPAAALSTITSAASGVQAAIA